MPVTVRVKEEEHIDKALRRLKRRVEREGLRREQKRHRFYEKPSTRRRRAIKERARAERKRQRKAVKQKRQRQRRIRRVRADLGRRSSSSRG